MGNRNRTAGHNWERETAEDYRSVGYEEACTTRYSSRKKDDAKIDIDFTVPFAVQCKYTKNQPNFSKLLDSIQTVPGEIPVIHYKRNNGRGGNKDEIVVLYKEDWLEFLSIMKRENIL